jgi:hypothetical protein
MCLSRMQTKEKQRQISLPMFPLVSVPYSNSDLQSSMVDLLIVFGCLKFRLDAGVRSRQP